jgi:uncharacterized membrane protein
VTFFILGLVVFIAFHSIPMVPRLHGFLVQSLGTNVYKGVYSLFSLIGLVILFDGFGAYREAGLIQVWVPPVFFKHLNYLFMLVSFISLAAAYAPYGYIKMRLKHPMLVGVKAWALGHLLANGDLGGMILFGALLAWAVVDRISFKWRPASTVELPAPRVLGDVIAVIVGIIAYIGMIHLHPILFGVSLMG